MESNPPLTNTPQSGAPTPSQPSTDANSLTPELVRQVAERVYTLLLNDLRAERQRLGLHTAHPLLSRKR